MRSQGNPFYRRKSRGRRRDRNRVTGAGLGFALAVLLSGKEAAERIQLILEYEPELPFHKGTPNLVEPERMAKVRAGRA